MNLHLFLFNPEKQLRIIKDKMFNNHRSSIIIRITYLKTY